VKQVVPLQPVDDHGGGNVHTAARGGPHATAGGDPLKEAAAHGEPIQSRLLAGAVAHGEDSMQEQIFWQDLWPVGDPQWSSWLLKDCISQKGSVLEQFVKNCSLREGPVLEKFMKDCLAWEGSHTGAGEGCEKEGAAETVCYELTAAPLPCHPAPLRGRR